MAFPCIIYSSDRQTRETCTFTSLETLLREARKLLGHGEEDKLSVVLEGDGARIRDEDVLLSFAQERHTEHLKLMILNNSRQEIWVPMSVPSTLTSPSVQTINIHQSQNIQVGDLCSMVEGRYMSRVSEDGEYMSNTDTGCTDAVSLDDISSIQNPIERLYATIAQPKLRFELDRIARQVDYNKVLTYRDSSGFNLLHTAAFYNENAMFTIWRHFDWSELSTQEVHAVRDTEHGELEGFTAMQIAVKKHNKNAEDRIKKLDEVEKGFKPIHKTVRSRNMTALKELYDHDHSVVNETNADNFTPLHVAAGIGYLDAVKYLLKLGADLNAITVEGETALGRACRMGYDDVVDYLIDLPNIDIYQSDCDGDTCLDVAARGNFRHIYDTLQDHGLPVTSNTLVCAAQGGHVNLVKEIAAMDGIDVNYQNKNGDTALHVAVITDRVNVADVLMAHCDADPTILNNEGKNTVHEAANRGHVQCLNTILSKHPTLADTPGKLYEGGLVYLVRGEDRGRPAWHYVLVRRKQLADFLVKTNGGSIAVADYGKVLHSGWGADPPEDIKQKIVDEYNKVKASAPEDLTPLHYACLEQHPTVVERLLKLGAQVDSCDAYGLTPLHLASMRGNETIVKLLVEAGADTKARDDDGDTPRDVAKLNHQEATVEILEKVEIIAFIKDNTKEPVKKLEEILAGGATSDVTMEELKDQIHDIFQQLNAAGYACLAVLNAKEEDRSDERVEGKKRSTLENLLSRFFK